MNLCRVPISGSECSRKLPTMNFSKTGLSIRLLAIALAVGACAGVHAQTAPAAPSFSSPSITIKLPDRIPAQCVSAAANRYQVPEMALLAILKQESGGRTGVVATNKNGSKDYGPAQFNDRSWGKYMRDKYGLSLDTLTNNMCQAIMAQAYALRYEWNRCIKNGNPSIWCGIAYYHSPTKKYQDIYVQNVWSKYRSIVARGQF